ncbi:DUF6702 family protein [Janthinobacterium fluminis]|uniref:Uncharacterized protein n=1 Tax=Janthinobacterium fluminis TaxID=2987524 RepID=A0ABT5K2K4_9BURK|nr:DUF6702 family protein [Janthinobacterium fluminis]MDC8758961.1 hypothetical protein [Janthinobacterium fluminis]
MRRHALRRALAAALLCWGASAAAHNYHMGMADVSFNAASGSTEIVHTYTAHDVEALLANLYQRRFDLSDAEDALLLRRYVEQRFAIVAPHGARLAPRWIGLQLDADNIVVFQELERSQLAPGTLIDNQVLTDFLAAQKNTVNVRGGGAVQSFFFDKSSGPQALR